jgi:hypothetical protein
VDLVREIMKFIISRGGNLNPRCDLCQARKAASRGQEDSLSVSRHFKPPVA